MTDGKVFVEVTMSLDGYIAGPNDGPDNPLGDGGDQLHQWIYGLSTWREQHGLEGGVRNRDAEILDESLVNTGASIVGRRMFDLAGEWGDDPPFPWPVFVVTHEARAPFTKGATTFTFVDGVEAALEQARTVAGGKNISIGGGASTAQQFLKAGLADELRLHVTPIFLGGGVRLFEKLDGVALEKTWVEDSPTVTHLKFALKR